MQISVLDIEGMAMAIAACWVIPLIPCNRQKPEGLPLPPTGVTIDAGFYP